MQKNDYDIIIIGGGLAGLSAAILLSKMKHNVLLIEKETYPFHRVCGEYISNESWNFLVNEIGVPLHDFNIPQIKKLWLTAPNGNSLNADLVLGGFGISRFNLDNKLQAIAKQHGVAVFENCKVDDVVFKDNLFSVFTNNIKFVAKVCCGAWGKRSNIDLKWKRPFSTKQSDRLNNYIGVKYHVTADFASDTIALHNFKNGYCGFSQIENNLYCICYLTKASNLKQAGSIEKMEATILSENPHLKKIFATAVKIFDNPVTISQISFSKKSCIENNVIMLGDAAGMITPLCGNGMSIALHTAKFASKHINLFLTNNIDRVAFENAYKKDWKKNFNARIKIGKMIQYFFGQKSITNIFNEVQ
jgi:menaquinone-9 beta-reductase